MRNGSFSPPNGPTKVTGASPQAERPQLTVITQALWPCSFLEYKTNVISGGATISLPTSTRYDKFANKGRATNRQDVGRCPPLRQRDRLPRHLNAQSSALYSNALPFPVNLLHIWHGYASSGALYQMPTERMCSSSPISNRCRRCVMASPRTKRGLTARAKLLWHLLQGGPLEGRIYSLTLPAYASVNLTCLKIDHGRDISKENGDFARRGSRLNYSQTRTFCPASRDMLKIPDPSKVHRWPFNYFPSRTSILVTLGIAPVTRIWAIQECFFTRL